MSFPSPARDWWQSPLSIDALCELKNPAVFLFRYAGEDLPFVKSGAVLVVDKSLTPQPGDLLLISQFDEIKLLPFDTLNGGDEMQVEGVVSHVVNALR